MTNILLLAIWVTQLAVLVMLRAILKQNDFTVEDDEVKATTHQAEKSSEEIADAISRLPKQNTKE